MGLAPSQHFRAISDNMKLAQPSKAIKFSIMDVVSLDNSFFKAIQGQLDH